MCFICDVRSGVPTHESTGVTRRYREECARREIAAADTPIPLIDVMSSIQDIVLIMDGVAGHFPLFRPYLAAFFAACAREIDTQTKAVSDV